MNWKRIKRIGALRWVVFITQVGLFAIGQPLLVLLLCPVWLALTITTVIAGYKLGVPIKDFLFGMVLLIIIGLILLLT